MQREVRKIVAYLQTTQGLDLTTSRLEVSSKAVEARLAVHGTSEAREYISILENQPGELATLIDLLTVTVSHFFRNPLAFELLAERILPEIIRGKVEQGLPELRIWSVGCASGEEPFSVALLIDELLEHEGQEVDVSIFATDINPEILNRAQAGIFRPEQMKNIKLHQVEKYFRQKGEQYILRRSITDMVSYSQYDIMAPNSYVPPECVFGDFDLVLCRNLLIYFTKDRQKIILRKIMRALAPRGYVLLGEAEHIPLEFRGQMRQCTDYCQIYQSLY